MATTIQIRRDSSTNWQTVNPILANGEFGKETEVLIQNHSFMINQ